MPKWAQVEPEPPSKERYHNQKGYARNSVGDQLKHHHCHCVHLFIDMSAKIRQMPPHSITEQKSIVPCDKPTGVDSG